MSLYDKRRYAASRKPICDLGFYNCCTVEVIARDRWTIFVEVPGGYYVEEGFEVDALSSSNELNRDALAAASLLMDVPTDDLYALHNGTPLLRSRDVPLYQLGIHDGSTIAVYPRMRGGVCVSSVLCGRKRSQGEPNNTRRERQYRKNKLSQDSVPRKERKHPYHDRVAIDSDLVQVIWEDSIENDIVIDDPYFATSNADYQRRVDAAREAIENGKKKNSSNYSFERGPFRAAPYAEQKVLDALFRFESRMANISHSVCANCRECSLNIVTSVRASKCTKCQDKKRRISYNDENNMLPVWIDDDGNRHYEIPKELSELTIAEKLLIQRVSPLVPIVHIKNGTLGIKGHVCSFLQDVNEVATRLPRLPTNVKAIKMVRTYNGSDGQATSKTYVVNRKRVMTALLWLVRYHCDYKQAHADGELVIDESNLGWMGGQDEAQLPSVATMTRTFESAADADGQSVPSVSDVHGLSPSSTSTDELESSGVICQADARLTNEASDALLQSLKESASKDGKVSVLEWPQTSTEALSEFSDAVKILPMPSRTCIREA